jgi:hypothetical protein
MKKLILLEQNSGDMSASIKSTALRFSFSNLLIIRYRTEEKKNLTYFETKKGESEKQKLSILIITTHIE